MPLSELSASDILDCLKQCDAFTYHVQANEHMWTFSYNGHEKRPYEVAWQPQVGDLAFLTQYVNAHFKARATALGHGIRWHRHTWQV